MYKYFSINENGHNIRCKLYYSELKAINKVIVFSHGFAGHKDNGACEKFSERLLDKTKGAAVIIFNLPCHGDDVKKKLRLQDCLTYLDIVIRYCRAAFNDPALYSCATSFGGYLVLRYIREHGDPFEKIALRCPAVNMYDVLAKTIIKKDEFDRILKRKNVSVGFDRKIEIDLPFLEELRQNDIQQTDYSEFAGDIRILHGTKDEIVPFEVSKRFAGNNRIAFLAVENADHRFKDPVCMDLAIKAILDFFAI